MDPLVSKRSVLFLSDGIENEIMNGRQKSRYSLETILMKEVFQIFLFSIESLCVDAFTLLTRQSP